jgi:hypothetical protein
MFSLQKKILYFTIILHKRYPLDLRQIPSIKTANGFSFPAASPTKIKFQIFNLKSVDLIFKRVSLLAVVAKKTLESFTVVFHT